MMPAIINEYRILYAECAGELSKKVMLAVRDGWQPYGPPLSHDGLLQQAIVVYSLEDGE